MNRRSFVATSLLGWAARAARNDMVDVAAIDRQRILTAAGVYIKEKPVTLTASHSPRSTGGPHDYFSEGDYWWPDPKDPEGPYVQRDGMSNPDNFNAHRLALIHFSLAMPSLTAAWKLTGDHKYADAAGQHLRAWFIDSGTRMNPNLQYAQAIHGRSTGRGTGVIDTIHLVEVARAASLLENSRALSARDVSAVRGWFTEYLQWMSTSKNGIEERDAKNNHGSCWVMQAAEFARYTGNDATLAFCRDRYKNVMLPGQFAADGSFPLELRRTKPYGYSLFNLDAVAMVCQILSTPSDNLWTFELPDGRGMKLAMQYMTPFIADKSKWPYPADVMYFDQWPVRQPSLLFAGLAFHDERLIALWRRLKPDSKVDETIRNWPIRQPLLWVD